MYLVYWDRSQDFDGLPSACSEVVLLSSVSSNPTFYVSSSSPSASDANEGTDPALPWRTLERGAAAAPQLQSGGALLLCSGDAWSIAAPLRFDGLGSAPGAARIRLGAYGSAAQRPLIRSASDTQAGPLLWLHNVSQVDLSRWELSGVKLGSNCLLVR